ncbi:MAG: hypothetical protein R3B52_03035 [Candidatus Paceibacterota bacterium]
MKQVLKVIIVSIVILGLVATYGLLGITTKKSQDQSTFQGPTSEPNIAGPSENPPTE